MEKRLITAALPYTNNVPHVGHIVGSHLPADIFARFCRLKGYDTLFIGGTDEHGTPSEIAAEKMGISPKELCDRFYKVHKAIYDWFNFSYDNFSRTSKKIHHQTTKDFFKKIYEKGYILKRKMKLPFCLSCQRFLADRYIEGVCPFCGYENARGDQCEKCGRVLDPIELKKPRCAICHSQKIEFREVEHLFLDLRKLSGKLASWIQSNRHWRSPVRSLALGWIKEGLKPRCITRDLKWGIKVPLEGFTKKRFYVWFEAPIGYISSTKEKFSDWKDYWTNPKAKIYHFVGKDNIIFHTIFWPGSLMAHGEFNLPYNVVGLQYLNYEGGKISKSKNWGVFCENLPEAALSPDYWRFYLTLLIPETADTDFKWEEFKERINGDLIGNFANFVHRTLSIIKNSFGGKIKANLKDLSSLDKELILEIRKSALRVDELLEKIELREALKEILALSAKGNKYFDYKAPWHQIKANKRKAQNTLILCFNLCKTLAILIYPYLPETSEKIWKQLNLKGQVKNKENWQKRGEVNLNTCQIGKPKILFEKLGDEKIEKIKAITTKT